MAERHECPFMPCTYRYAPIRQRTDPQRPDEQKDVVPTHLVQPDEWYGRCPASQMDAPVPNARQHQHLVEAYVGFLTRKLKREQGKDFRPGPVWHARPGVRRESELTNGGLHEEREACWVCAEAGIEQWFPGRLEVLVHIATTHGVDSRPDANRPPGGDVSAYFPTRPAEGESTTPTTGAGENMTDNRSGLKAMLALIQTEGGLAGDAVVNTTNFLDLAFAQVEALSSLHQSAAALAIQAVGGNVSELPQSAADMIAASSRLGELVNEMRDKIMEAKVKSEEASRTSQAVIENARTFAGSF